MALAWKAGWVQALAGSNPASSAPGQQKRNAARDLTSPGGGFEGVSQLVSGWDQRSPPTRLATSCQMGSVTCW